MNKTTISSFVACMSAVLGLFAFWPHVEPALNWFINTSSLILQRPQVQAVITAMTIGVLLASILPHLPCPWFQRLPAYRVKAIVRLVCFALTFTCAYLLANPADAVAQRTALIYALLAALASAQVWTTMAGVLYRFRERPESLKP